MKSVKIKRNLALLAVILMATLSVGAQQVLTLQECRDMALENNKNLKMSQEKVNMASYDKKIAWANYFRPSRHRERICTTRKSSSC